MLTVLEIHIRWVLVQSVQFLLYVNQIVRVLVVDVAYAILLQKVFFFLNKAESSSNAKFEDNSVSIFSSYTPSGNVSGIQSKTASDQNLSKSAKSFDQQTQNQLILNHGLSLYMTNSTRGCSISFWFLYEDQEKDHIFF